MDKDQREAVRDKFTLKFECSDYEQRQRLERHKHAFKHFKSNTFIKQFILTFRSRHYWREILSALEYSFGKA